LIGGGDMRLSPRDREMLLVHVAAELAKKRKADFNRRKAETERRLGYNISVDFKFNYPEAMAIITSYILEEARAGLQSVSELEDTATREVGRVECMDGVPEMMRDLAVEATFPDGTKMVAVREPIMHDVVPPPAPPATAPNTPSAMKPGEITANGDVISFNARPNDWQQKWPDREWQHTVRVRNDGDRAIQVGSHFHFYEANSGFTKDSSDPSTNENVGFLWKGLVVLDGNDVEVSAAEKERLTAGYRLDIPAGTAWRFEPGPDPYDEVPLVALSGEGTVWGLSTEGTLNGYQWTQAGAATQGAGSGSTGSGSTGGGV
jgi:urease gamma subunit